jgi:hypothetical protein
MFATATPTKAPTTAPFTMATVTTTLAQGECFKDTDCSSNIMVSIFHMFAMVMLMACRKL